MILGDNMKLIENIKYFDDIKYISELPLPWDKLQNKSVLISGASGMIGSCLIDVIMQKNKEGMNCKIYAIGRNKDKIIDRFSYCAGSNYFKILQHDINQPLLQDDIGDVDFVIHLASNTHPVAYANDPIGTISANIIGTQNMLDFAVKHNSSRAVFASSVEVYGENRGDTEYFSEDYCGYINPNTLRAGYPESKRCGEALCQAYIKQKNIDVVIARLSRSYGPTMLMSDSKAISQFIKKGLASENIVLKSTGNQFYSYTYVSDAVSGLLTVLLKGKTGEAYNIADERSDITLKDLAEKIASYAGTRVVFEIPDETEKLGYSTATKALLDGNKLKSLGWSAEYDMDSGISRTLDILKIENQ